MRSVNIETLRIDCYTIIVVLLYFKGHIFAFSS